MRIDSPREMRSSREMHSNAISSGSDAISPGSPRVNVGEYPDQGSSAEIYTNPDPTPYVELEMLGPLYTMKIGDQLSQTNTYTLIRRSVLDPESEARKLLIPPR